MSALNYRVFSRNERKQLRILLNRAVRNEQLPGHGSNQVKMFGRDFSCFYNVAVDAHRSTRIRRDSGHPGITHPLSVALGLLGYGNLYHLVPESQTMVLHGQTLPSPYTLMSYKEAHGVSDYQRRATCTGLWHDVVEDTPITLEEIRKNNAFSKIPIL